MKSFNSKTVGRTTVIGGICALGLSISLFTFPWIGDFLEILAYLLIIPMFIALGNIVSPNRRILSGLITTAGVTGSLIEVIQSILFGIGLFSHEQVEPWVTFSRGLMGVALLTFVLLSLANAGLKRSYVWLGILVGLVMILSFLGLLFPDFARLGEAIFEGEAAGANPIIVALFIIQIPLYLLGWPIWLIWTGRLFLQGKLAQPAG
jgi:uncharacterized MAPEG superfamily protein